MKRDLRKLRLFSFVMDYERRTSMDNRIIAVDFDGTLCINKFPEIGLPNENVIHYIKERKKQGAKLILWTCRVGEQLKEAVKWCKMHGIEFDAVNENLPEIIEMMGGDTRKIFADEYLDDKCINVYYQKEEMKNYKYGIYIEQSHGINTNEATTHYFKLFDIQDIIVSRNSFFCIGKFPNSAMSRDIFISPTGLVLTPYVKEKNHSEIERVIKELKKILEDDVWDVTVNLSLDDLPEDNYQIIRIHKTLA